MPFEAIIGIGTLAVWGVFVVTWVVLAAGAGENKRLQERGSQLVQAVPIIAGAFLLLQRRDLGPLSIAIVPTGHAKGIAGLALTAAGVGIAIWARLTLGTNWSGRVSLKKSHQLITQGPYALARHPIYTGLLTAVTGTALWVGEVRSLVALALFIGAFAWKMRLEEKWMREEFGAMYEVYRAKVKALIPYLL